MVSFPRFLRTVSFLPVALLLLTVAATGCEDKHIGRPCDVVPPDTNPKPTPGSTGIVNSAALECPSRICVLPPAQRPVQDTGATCSAECSSDSDCEDAEQRGKDADDKRCKSSYFCRVATNLGGFACRKLCLCGDFINTSEAPGPCNKAL